MSRGIEERVFYFEQKGATNTERTTTCLIQESRLSCACRLARIGRQRAFTAMEGVCQNEWVSLAPL